MLAEGLEQLLIAALERSKQRLPAAPPRVGEEAGACPQELPPRQRWDRPLVECVLPGHHGSADRGPAQGVAGALAVGDVQQCRTHSRLLSFPGEVGGAAGAVVE